MYVGEGSSATFAKSLFRDNVATVLGGADIAVQAATLTVESTAFEGGTGPGYGASLRLDRPSFLKILHSTFNPMLDGAATVFLAGRLAGCNEHPCAAGNKCSYANYSLTCTPCDEATVSSGGLQCVSCGAGTGPNANQTACVACANASFSAFGVCQACADSKEPNEVGTACQKCAAGRTGKLGRCNECMSGFYALAENDPCVSCATLELPAQFHVTEVCPGGVPGRAAGICPMQGMWVHFGRAAPQLLECETTAACAQHDSVELCTGWLAEQRELKSGANKCSAGTTGFMCLQCTGNASKVGGKCFDCPGVDWTTMLLSLLTNLCTALFLLHKSTNATVSKDEIEEIWLKVDLENTGELDGQKVGAVLRLLGKDLSEAQLNKTLTKSLNAVAPRFAVPRKTFVEFQSYESPTAAVGTAVFFVQTFALLAKDASFFGMGSLLNLDAEEASGRCLSPMTYSQR